ncbi:D-inositol-3-phosphate glycosyltransferase [compost metagenome]
MGKSLLKYCHILASTDQEKLDVLQIVKPKSISILPNLVNLPFTNWEPEIDFLPVNEKRKTKNEKSTTHIPFNLLFLSRINEIKGLDILLEALALVEIKWQLTIAGKGEEIYVDSLKEKAKSLKINNNIKWIGQVNNEDKFELMAQHDLLILTSYRESFANVIIESLSMGTPVLVSNEVGLSRYVIEKRLGYVTTLKTNHIANEIKTAYLEKDNRQRIRVDGPRIIYNDFNTDILIQHYLKLYKEIT